MINVCVTGVIMASGFSRRMKTEKLLLKLGNKTLIERVIDSCIGSKLSEIIVIYRTDEVKFLIDQFKIKSVLNSNAQEGQSASVKLGIHNASSSTRGIMFIVGDQPYLGSDTIDLLIEEFQYDEKIIIPKYGEKNGNPIIFPRDVFDDFNALEGDVGGREVIKKNLDKVRYVQVENQLAGKDMDTFEEYEKLKENFKDDYR